METSMVVVKLDLRSLDVRRGEYISGRISGIMAIVTCQEESDVVFGHAVITDENNKPITVIHRCMATNDEIETLKKYLLTNELYKKIITIEVE